MIGRLCAAGAAIALVGGLFVGAEEALAQAAVGASALLQDTSGKTVGSALFSEVAGGVRVTAQVQGLTPGRHGIHLHEVGRCDPPAFTTAGGHFNPTNRQHGLANSLGTHAGDMVELVAPASGTASYATTNMMVTLGAGPTSLFDADGSALVIHADPDDQMTDPSGNSGARIVCGVLVRGAAALPATGGGSPTGRGGVIGTAGAAVAAIMAAAGALLRGTRRRR